VLHHAGPFIIHPLNLNFGIFTVTGFGLAVMLAFIIGQIVAQAELTRRGHDPAPMADVTIAAVVGFLVGAKLYYAVLMHDWHLILARSGFVFWGGFIGSVLASWLVIRAQKVPFWRMADVAGPGIAAGYAVGRTGCWAVGDDYGRPWTGPWAVAFPNGSPASTAGNMATEFGIKYPPSMNPNTLLGVHPTQLYEVAMGLVMFGILWRLRGHKHSDGWLFGLYLLLAGVERFAVEFVRAKDDRFIGPLTMAQAIALGMIALGAALMYARRETGAGMPGIYAQQETSHV
jgi:phosphatidylglycerol:prolipoprotein diacylglycerol transferase